jgi:Na+/proline symporter
VTKNILAQLSYLLLIAVTFIQVGASLFAIVVNVSTLVSAPPASLAMVQGEYAFDPGVFWGIFPNVAFVFFVITLILNWKTDRRKWVIAGWLVGLLAGLAALFLLEPVQAEFLSAKYSESVDQDLKAVGNT